MLMHFHVYVLSFSYIFIYYCVGTFLIISLSLHSCVSLLLWHLRPRTLYVLRHLLPPTPHLLLFGSMMRTPERTSRRTFVDEAFIQNATSFYQIFLTLTYPLSFTVGVGSHFVTFWSLVLLWSYMNFTPICMESKLQYLISSLSFEVCVL